MHLEQTLLTLLQVLQPSKSLRSRTSDFEIIAFFTNTSYLTYTIKNHDIKYCEQVCENDKLLFWSITNASEVLKKLNSIQCVYI